MKRIQDFIGRHKALVAILAIVLFVGAGYPSFTSLFIYGSLKGTNTALHQYPINMNNKDGTARFKVDSAGAVTGTTALRGSAIFTLGDNVDTIVIKGMDSLTYVTATPLFRKTITADTTAFEGLFVRPWTDTLFVYQLSAGGTLKAVKYLYIAIH